MGTALKGTEGKPCRDELAAAALPASLFGVYGRLVKLPAAKRAVDDGFDLYLVLHGQILYHKAERWLAANGGRLFLIPAESKKLLALPKLLLAGPDALAAIYAIYILPG